MLSFKESTEKVARPKTQGKVMSGRSSATKKTERGVILATPYVTVMCNESFDRFDKESRAQGKRNPALAEAMKQMRARTTDG